MNNKNYINSCSTFSTPVPLRTLFIEKSLTYIPPLHIEILFQSAYWWPGSVYRHNAQHLLMIEQDNAAQLFVLTRWKCILSISLRCFSLIIVSGS